MINYIINIIKILSRKTFFLSKKNFSLRDTLAKNFTVNQPFRFIQVGAWDGTGYDFLYDFVKERKSSGIVIEPLPDYFEKLKKNYTYNPSVIAVNKAVFHEKKEIELYRVDPARTDGLPDWAGGIASVDPAHHKKAHIPSSVIITERVQADTLMNIIKEYYPYRVADLFQVDVEGYDFDVLKQLDFTFLKPDIIKFEYINLPAGQAEEAVRLLKAKGYYCFYDDIDIIAVRLKKIKL